MAILLATLLAGCGGNAKEASTGAVPIRESIPKTSMWASTDSPPTGLTHPAGHDLPSIVFDGHNLLNGRAITNVSSVCTPLPASVDLRVTFADGADLWVKTTNGDHGVGEPWSSPVIIRGPDMVPYKGDGTRTGPSNNIPNSSGGPDAWFSINGRTYYSSRLDTAPTHRPADSNATHTFSVKLECANYSA